MGSRAGKRHLKVVSSIFQRLELSFRRLSVVQAKDVTSLKIKSDTETGTPETETTDYAINSICACCTPFFFFASPCEQTACARYDNHGTKLPIQLGIFSFMPEKTGTQEEHHRQSTAL